MISLPIVGDFMPLAAESQPNAFSQSPTGDRHGPTPHQLVTNPPVRKPRAVWSIEDEQALVHFLIDRKAEAGDGANFTRMTWVAVSHEMMRCPYVQGAKTADTSQEYVRLDIFRSGIIEADSSVWADFAQKNSEAAQLGKSGFPLFDMMSLVMPTAARGTHAYRALFSEYGSRGREKGKEVEQRFSAPPSHQMTPQCDEDGEMDSHLDERCDRTSYGTLPPAIDPPSSYGPPRSSYTPPSSSVGPPSSAIGSPPMALPLLASVPLPLLLAPLPPTTFPLPALVPLPLPLVPLPLLPVPLPLPSTLQVLEVVTPITGCSLPLWHLLLSSQHKAAPGVERQQCDLKHEMVHE
ncbi:hypothetical protein K439DRAFT_1617226 [Ramaria rubella]|nr:hypothetical protein K439DRAFT_1617226 [Ramaria rubella]